MRIAVVGDTHGKTKVVAREIEKQKADYIFFTGDYYPDAQKISRTLRIPFTGVSGNCDSSYEDKKEIIISLKGKTFYIVHGHQYGVKTSLNRLFYRGKELNADLLAYGHTHVPCIEKIEDIYLMNPGSPTMPRSKLNKSYGLIDIKDNEIFPQIVFFE